MAPRFAPALHLHFQHTATCRHRHADTHHMHPHHRNPAVWHPSMLGWGGPRKNCLALSCSLTLSSPHSSLWNWGGTEAVSSAQLLCVTYRVSPIAMGKFVVVNTGHYSSRCSLRDVSMAWRASPKCRELQPWVSITRPSRRLAPLSPCF